MDTNLIGITDLRSNTKAIIDDLHGPNPRPITVLSRSKPVAILIRPDRYEQLLDRLDDLEAQIAIATATGDTMPIELARKEILGDDA